jgi:hypothetical protein
MDQRGNIYPLQTTQPTSTTIQPRRITIGLYTGATRICRHGTSKIRQDMSVVALYKQYVRFEVAPRSETWQEQMASNLRFIPHE